MKRQNPAKLAAEQHDADLRAVMGSPAGRRFVQRLITRAGLRNPILADSHSTMAYLEGQRAVAIALVAECERVCPAEFASSECERVATELEANTMQQDDAPGGEDDDSTE